MDMKDKEITKNLGVELIEKDSTNKVGLTQLPSMRQILKNEPQSNLK
jgi:hypothetical protein